MDVEGSKGTVLLLPSPRVRKGEQENRPLAPLLLHMEGRWCDLEYKDYYKALGISKSATQKEVQSAYRKLARKLHPDVNKKPDAEESFKAINEAYEVLKDPEKRERYDTLGANWREGERYNPPPGNENIHFDFGSGNAGQFSDFFEGLFGHGRGSSRFSQEMPGWAMRGADQETDIELTLEEAYNGVTKTLRLQQLEPEGSAYVQKSREVNVNIPSGVSEGSRIRLSGQGGPGSGGQNGDLYLRVRFLPHKLFKITGMIWKQKRSSVPGKQPWEPSWN